MGQIAGKYADVVVLTEEDDRDTPGEEILETIAKGARKGGRKEEDILKILDRPSAILAACKMAKKGDTVLFLGKGNEKTIERADGVHDYYELTEVKKALRKIVKKAKD
jgi:UDP-N-acetylmuramoyl-L-alanyl-D-glutamate--2,6-diaminopimelate ligase